MINGRNPGPSVTHRNVPGGITSDVSGLLGFVSEGLAKDSGQDEGKFDFYEMIPTEIGVRTSRQWKRREEAASALNPSASASRGTSAFCHPRPTT